MINFGKVFFDHTPLDSDFAGNVSCIEFVSGVSQEINKKPKHVFRFSILSDRHQILIQDLANLLLHQVFHFAQRLSELPDLGKAPLSAIGNHGLIDFIFERLKLIFKPADLLYRLGPLMDHQQIAEIAIAKKNLGERRIFSQR